MKTLLNPACKALLGALVGLASSWAVPAAATPLALTKSFEGNINFAGTQASVQSKKGGAKVCDLESSVTASVSLPSKASVVSAILYWAGTGPVDPEVLFNNKTVTAPSDRRYSSAIDGLTYFAAAADVTAQVKAVTRVKDKIPVSFGGLDVSKAAIYCDNQQKENTMVAGFSLAVVYALEGEPYRAVNVYEGLHAIKNSSVTVQMGDYTPPADRTGAGRFGYIVWEGDKSGQQKGDSVTFAGQDLFDPPFVQKGDAFNAKSGANRDETANGIDFDIVDIQSPPASSADARAVFVTENDRVLLGTAIAALPSKPSDLSIKKTASGEFKTGNEIVYTLSVTNEGGRADSNVSVTDTLADALSFVSASGAGWTCSVLEKTVTCKYGKPLAPGATAAIRLTANITGSGKIANTAEVKGTLDTVPGNNSSTAEGDAGSPPVVTNGFVFTAGPCQVGEQIKTTGDGCAQFTGPVIAGSTPSIYLTHAQGGVAKPVSSTSKSSLGVRYSLECNNPETGAGTIATYAGLSLPACGNNGTAVKDAAGADGTLEFEANQVSKQAAFVYEDAGRITLRLIDKAGNIATATFVSLPKSLKAVYQRVDGAVLNPASTTLAEPGFAEAGEPFQVIVSAYGVDENKPLKNFGKESGEYALSKRLAVLADQPHLLKSYGDWGGAGSVARTFSWNEVGMARLSTSLGAYLGAGEALATKLEIVGRFYPQYFETELSGGFGCLKRMGCPAAAPGVITRAVYSRQGFGATVHAYGRNGLLEGYGDAKNQHLIPQIALQAVSAPGGQGKELDGLGGGAAAANVGRELAFRLANAYDAKADIKAGAKAARDWTVPTAVYVRAVAPELRAMPAGAAPVAISSLREKDSVEDGVMVVNGRLMVGNTIGTPLARTAVPLRAQYWSGQAWEQNGGVEELESVMGSVEFSACRRSLRLSTATGDVCDPVVKVFGAQAATDTVALPMLKGGKANLILAPVGDKSGNVDVFVNGSEYLPSTFGRVSFGQFKSPVIYVREMY
jgi:uncharacterized repeat protein (TIGR01451 family)